MKGLRSWIAVVACAVAAAAALTARAAVSVTDDRGSTVTLSSPAKRIVSLAPHSTELLFAIGAGPRVVGVMSYSDYPPEAAGLPVVGTASALDLERILMLKPDLIVTWPYTAPAQIDILHAQGIPVFTTNPRTIVDIARDLERLGALTGNDREARDAAERFRSRLAGLERQSKGKTPLRVFYQVSDLPLYTVGGEHLITQALRVCGAENVFAGLTLPAPEVNVEAVLAARPLAIIAGTANAARPSWLDGWRRWTDMPAARYGNLYVVDGNLLHRPGPRFVEGVAQLCDVVDAGRQAARQGKAARALPYN